MKQGCDRWDFQRSRQGKDLFKIPNTGDPGDSVS